ncbi:MAG: SDR family NAD(P)-dependent oxidoreductase [Waddliaceae bacterium]|nr:SDR family NAD(P)-dependent oxidoreductase [Waddliaceae bacterium]MBT7462183.1 SDR family NAD(P)-dependent oxidoreductase [Waddliaceae bacterium]
MKKNRPLAVITGASSGIGAEYARRYADMGYDVFLVARREELLKKLCSGLEEKHGITATYAIVELSDRSAVEKLTETISTMRNLEVIINNAGFATGVPEFEEGDIEGWVQMLNIHDEIPMRLIAAAIPMMKKRKKGTIINVSSIAGFFVGSVMYYSTKAFLTNFSESLALELARHNIKVQALCPGLTRTDFHKKLGWHDNDPRYKEFMSVKDVVATSLRDIKKPWKTICIPGFKNKLLVGMAYLLPRRLLYTLIRYNKKKRFIHTISK